MDELVVASEEMDRTIYGQAVTHGATFMYLESSDTSCHVVQQGIDPVGERFVAESLSLGLWDGAEFPGAWGLPPPGAACNDFHEIRPHSGLLPTALSEDLAAALQEDESAAVVGDRRRGSTSIHAADC
jgi:hypothetical protein